MMQSKIERATVIARTVIAAGEAFARTHARDRSETRKCVDLSQHGWNARITFTHLSSLLALLDPANAVAADCQDWTELNLRIGGQQKLFLRYRGTEIVPEVYAPGPWERQFGVDPGDDGEILLPFALRPALLPRSSAAGQS